MQPQESLVSPPFPVEGTPQGSVCRWTSPDQKHRIIIPAALLKELVHSAIQGFVAVPRRGLEVGGLLFGRVRKEGSTTVYEIASRQVIPCDHTWGPSYSFGEGDHERFRQTLSFLAEESPVPVIGFYRSYTGREAMLDDGDQELLRRAFPGRCMPCVLLRPESIQTCETSVQFWNAGAAEPEIAAPVSEPDPDPEPEPQVQPVAPPARFMPSRLRHAEFDERPEPPARRFPWILPALCCLLTGITLAAIVQVWRLSRAPGEVPLQLNAEPSADGLVVKWDALPSATAGSLDVRDGAGTSAIPLQADQLRTGNVPYKPASPNPFFRLRLFHDGQELASGSLRVLRMAATPVAAAPAQTPAAPAASKSGEPFAALKAEHQVEPALSPGIRARITTPVTIPVVARVDHTGHVIGAWSHLRGTNGMERYLIDASIQAARSWTFAPPPVQTLTSIRFQFRPQK